MIELLKNEAARHGDRAEVISIQRLQEIRQDLDALKSSEKLNNFQQYIVNEIYQFDVPEAGFEARSIILVAAPCASTIEIIFNRQGKQIPTILPASYAGKDAVPRRIEQYLKDFLDPRGYHIRCAPNLPMKRLAVRSGLGVYGRNNICYVEGMGSFLNLSMYFCDIPCQEDRWQDVRQMDRCNHCRMCLENCPTAAILPGRFLIDNERCLTYFNESGGEWDFPGWIDPSVHHTLYGCMRCQAICPVNKPYLKNIAEPVEFTEEESALLLGGTPSELFPDGLRQKVMEIDLHSYLGVLSRNLRALYKEIQWQ